jgi:hypothetical protein
MADRNNLDVAVYDSVAVGMLALFSARHYGYYLFNGADRAHVWNISGAVICLMFAGAIFLAYPSRAMALVLAWIGFEEVQVVMCGVAWLWNPWNVPAGQDVCSSAIGFNLAAIGIVLITFLLIRLPVRSDRVR